MIRKFDMRKLIVTGFILIGITSVLAENSNVFPLNRLRLEMSSTDFLKEYPDVKMAFASENDDGKLTKGLLLYEIVDSIWWTSALINVRDGKVQSWSYVTTDFDHANRNVNSIRKRLTETLGETSEKKVVFHLLKQGRVRSPMYIWKRGNAFFVYTHSPVAIHSPGDPFISQLSVVPDYKALHGLFDVAEEAKDNDADLFIMEETSDK